MGIRFFYGVVLIVFSFLVGSIPFKNKHKIDNVVSDL